MRIAAGKLRLAKQNLERPDADLRNMAERLLQDVVDDYADTPSAGEARSLLDTLQ